MTARAADFGSRLRTLLSTSVAARYGCAAALVAAGFAARALLQPALGTGHIYLCFYPAVILTAHLLGARPATAAAVLSGALGYWFFSQPAFTLKTELGPYVPLLFFAASSALAIYILSHLRGSLSYLGEALGRSEGLSRSQAELFRDHARRVGDHLQLVAALLQLHGRYDSETSASRALNNAASRTLLISRMHRDFAGQTHGAIQFEAFARGLAEAALAVREDRELRVAVDADGVELPLEQATALGLVLLEAVRAREATSAPGTLRVSLREGAGEYVFRVVEFGSAAAAATPRDRELLEALTDQLGGRLVLAADAHGFAWQVAFPSAPPLLPDWRPLGIAVH